MDSLTATRIGSALEAMLLQQLLGPLMKSDGALGEYGNDAVAQAIAERDADGFGALIARKLEPSDG